MKSLISIIALLTGVLCSINAQDCRSEIRNIYNKMMTDYEKSDQNIYLKVNQKLNKSGKEEPMINEVVFNSNKSLKYAQLNHVEVYQDSLITIRILNNNHKITVRRTNDQEYRNTITAQMEMLNDSLVYRSVEYDCDQLQKNLKVVQLKGPEMTKRGIKINNLQYQYNPLAMSLKNVKIEYRDLGSEISSMEIEFEKLLFGEKNSINPTTAIKAVFRFDGLPIDKYKGYTVENISNLKI